MVRKTAKICQNTAHKKIILASALCRTASESQQTSNSISPWLQGRSSSPATRTGHSGRGLGKRALSRRRRSLPGKRCSPLPGSGSPPPRGSSPTPAQPGPTQKTPSTTVTSTESATRTTRCGAYITTHPLVQTPYYSARREQAVSTRKRFTEPSGNKRRLAIGAVSSCTTATYAQETTCNRLAGEKFKDCRCRTFDHHTPLLCPRAQKLSLLQHHICRRACSVRSAVPVVETRG